MSEEQKSRREILRRTAYVVPTVLTLAAKPSLASSGSGRYDEYEKRGREEEEHGNSWRERESKKPKKNGKKD